jgi:DNA-binding transcriptional ArsR family regulator
MEAEAPQLAVDPQGLPADLRGAFVETLRDPFRTQVYTAVYERPQVTVGRLARRLGESPRRIRHQLDRLTAIGMVVRDGTETRRRNVREQHYRAVVVPTFDEDDHRWIGDELRGMLLSLMRLITTDIARALRHRTLGLRRGHTEMRVPGEVDEQGWEEIEQTTLETMAEVERIMVASAGRLAEAGKPGFETIVALLLFSGRAWEPGGGPSPGPRPSIWAHPRRSGAYDAVGPEPSDPPLPADLPAALRDALADPRRSRIFFTVAERPGVTVAQIAARIDETPRRVRHQVERLVAAGLIYIDAESQRRNTRERHYRTVAVPAVVDDSGPDWTDAQRQLASRSVIDAIMADLDGALRARTFADRPGHAILRIPGEVDDRGWEELTATLYATAAAIEDSMSRSHARLAAAGRGGMEAISALLLFEIPAWERSADDPPGPRPSQWRTEKPGGSRASNWTAREDAGPETR